MFSARLISLPFSSLALSMEAGSSIHRLSLSLLASSLPLPSLSSLASREIQCHVRSVVEMVNNIPLGPNAVILKVEKVIVKSSYLWRPISSELYLMGDALHEFIAWPIGKIGLTSPPKRASTKASAHTSVSCSKDKSNSNQQKKCKLLDVNNSGKVVAEGTISSSNPEDTIHFVPLGPNASKVWVQVVKIGTAEVWRPNSEIEFISDALGTTVAWPNDKLVLM